MVNTKDNDHDDDNDNHNNYNNNDNNNNNDNDLFHLPKASFQKIQNIEIENNNRILTEIKINKNVKYEYFFDVVYAIS